MAAPPHNRETFKNYCLRRLGAPVLQINVEADQIDDRISDALQFWVDYHYDGTEKMYYKYKLTQTDIDNRTITLPENIIGAVSIFPIGMGINSSNFFDVRYQMALNDLWDLTSVEMAPYVMARTYYQMIEQIIIGLQPIRYNRHTNILHIDMSWSRMEVDEYVIVECYSVIDPDVYTDAWNDRWLKEYATALIKRQWGEHLNKFKDQKLPGGMVFNGASILADAERTIEKLESEMINKYGGVLEFFQG